MRRPALLCLPALLLACPEEPPEPSAAPAVLEVTAAPYLTDGARAAVGFAPAWLADDLALALQDLPLERQDLLAATLARLRDHPLLDEVAFVLAHLPERILASSDFDPELVRLDAQLLVDRAALLPYVDLVETEDGRTSARYRVVTVSPDGVEVESQFTLDPADYYWFVVHPRLDTETPAFVDAEAEGAPPTDPGIGGSWWRTSLWTAEAGCGEECPPLASLLPEQPVLWKRRGGLADNGAIGAVAGWVAARLDPSDTSVSERSDQPMRVLTLGGGGCEERARLTAAALRSALVPAVVARAPGNAHCWNEFRDPEHRPAPGPGWAQLEPTAGLVDHTAYYADDDGRYRAVRNGLDDDCDGLADGGDSEEDRDGDGVRVSAGDCDDTDPLVRPGAIERPNARDDDCDGVADPGLSAAFIDADGDGWSIPDGDCHDLDADRHPGAPELPNGVDDDCDGRADDGTAQTDADGDGWSPAAGDCDDTDPSVRPNAAERNDGRDEDCNGVPDDGMGAFLVDRDGDGLSVIAGDCDDTRAGTRPDAADPLPLPDRLYTVGASRGDGRLLDHTPGYVRTFPLVVRVRDAEGRPVPGAAVSLYGPAEALGSEEHWFVGEAYADASGNARIRLGEANTYSLRVGSAIGDEPVDPDRRIEAVAWGEHDVGVELGVTIDRPGPPRPDAVQAPAPEGTPAWRLSVSHVVDGTRVEAESPTLRSAFREAGFGAGLDRYVVDGTGYRRFTEARRFEALGIVRDSERSELLLELPEGSWTVVLAGSWGPATSVVGELEVSLEPLSPGAEPVVLNRRFRLGPRDHLAVAVRPAE